MAALRRPAARAAATRVSPRLPRRWLSAGVTLGLLLALLGCTYDAREPGLFQLPSPSPTEKPSRPPPQTAVASLPIAGEAEWTTAEGLDLSVRFAVHAVRRIEGATVLDWSVTPLPTSRYAFGEDVPAKVDLAIGGGGGSDLTIALLDLARERVYRPLQHRSRREFNRCLCTPLWVAQQDLRIGETRLLQAAFPPLPADVAFVDVSLGQVAPISHVPVTPIGFVPSVRARSDLARPARAALPAGVETTVEDSGQPGRRLVVRAERVVVAADQTAVEWQITALAKRANLDVFPPGLPLSADVPDSLNPVPGAAISGPLIRAGGTSLGVIWMTASVFDHPAVQCLCSTVGAWALALRQPGGSARIVGVYPPVPAGTDRVTLSLPGVTELPAVHVVAATDAALNLGLPVEAGHETWTYFPDDPPRGWLSTVWPTPVPDSGQLGRYQARVSQVVPIPAR